MGKKWTSTRFAAPSQDFDLEILVRRLRRGFILSVGIAAAVHLLIAGINPFKQIQAKAPRPLSTKFIKRQARLTKPLELRKIPQPKRQLARREVHLARARMDQVQATAAFDTRTLIASNLGNSGIGLASQANFSALHSIPLEPELFALDVSSAKTSEFKFDMALEMLDVKSMDTGRYQAMVVQDENDPQGIKGFLKIAHVISARSVAAGIVGFSNLNLSSIDRLCDVINEYTGLQASFVGTITYDDERLHEIPIIIPQGEPNEAELENLARYLLGGGFVLGAYWTEALVKYGGLIEGQDFWAERLLPEHPIFSSFFKVPGGHARTSDWRHMTGYYVKGRMVGIRSIGWGSSLSQNQVAINVIIYALTQEGSITQRLMQMVN